MSRGWRRAVRAGPGRGAGRGAAPGARGGGAGAAAHPPPRTRALPRAGAGGPPRRDGPHPPGAEPWVCGWRRSWGCVGVRRRKRHFVHGERRRVPSRCLRGVSGLGTGCKIPAENKRRTRLPEAPAIPGARPAWDEP